MQVCVCGGVPGQHDSECLSQISSNDLDALLGFLPDWLGDGAVLMEESGETFVLVQHEWNVSDVIALLQELTSMLTNITQQQINTSRPLKYELADRLIELSNYRSRTSLTVKGGLFNTVRDFVRNIRSRAA